MRGVGVVYEGCMRGPRLTSAACPPRESPSSLASSALAPFSSADEPRPCQKYMMCAAPPSYVYCITYGPLSQPRLGFRV